MSDQKEPGLRERKRQETLQRITETGLRLFMANGFDATTVDAIAAAAGISRRTFFHYFKSKDDIVLSLHQGFADPLIAALALRAEGEAPLAAIRAASMRIAEGYPLDDLVAIDRVMLSSEVVRAGKQAGYAQDEIKLLAALRDFWPQEDDLELRLLAMLTIGSARVALDAWRSEGGTRPLADYVAGAFDRIEGFGRG